MLLTLVHQQSLKAQQLKSTAGRAQVPTLETPTGGVWESNAIARYVARLSDKGLFGASAFEEARAWLSACSKLTKQRSRSPRSAKH